MIWTIAVSATAACAQTTPSPSPSPLADPCGSLLATVNRPTVSTSACSVRTGHVLIETGYANTTTTGTGAGSTVTYPQGLVRIGTFDPHLEFDFTPPGYNRTSSGGSVLGGAGDMAIGMQTEIGYSSAAVWGANAFVTIPSGSPAFTAGAAQYVANVNFSDTLSSNLSLFATMGFNALSAPNAAGTAQSYFAFLPSVGLSLALPAGSQAYGEVAYYSQAGPGLGGKWLFDAGYQHLIGPHVLFDLSGGLSPTVVGGARQQYVGFGFSFMN